MDPVVFRNIFKAFFPSFTDRSPEQPENPDSDPLDDWLAELEREDAERDRTDAKVQS